MKEAPMIGMNKALDITQLEIQPPLVTKCTNIRYQKHHVMSH
jgi:hypothetical protein